jgi:uncharacterized membrane-anchored protein
MLSKFRLPASLSASHCLPAILLFTIIFSGRASFAADDPKPTGIEWHKGPYKAHLGDIAEMDVPEGYRFTDAAGARRFLELTHNPSDDSDLGIITPIRQPGDSDDNGWFMLFTFDEIGFVSDSEKSSLDAPKILTSLQKNAEESNEFRKQKGWAAFHISDWQKPPFYDEKYHNLTWATLGNSDDPKEGQTVNYSTRILGRRGAMSIDLVLDPTQMNSAVPIQEKLLSGFTFSQGNRYAEFVKGDKVASYGLTALIAGGAAAAVVKTGLLAKLLAMLAAFWKVIVVAFAAMGAAIKKFFTGLKERIFGKKSSEQFTDPKALESSVISSDHNDPN